MALKLAGEDPMKGAAVDRQDDGSKSEIMDSVDIICKLLSTLVMPETKR